MAIPKQVTLRGIAETEALESRINQKIEKLSRFYNHILFCKVVVDIPEKRQHQGKLFNVRIEIGVPNKEIVAKRELDEDLYVAIRDAFKDAVRQLEEYAQIRRGDVKLHQAYLVGHIVRLFREGQYGFIETPYGEEYYFNAANLLHPAFEKLNIGDTVEFFEAVANDGLQARHIRVIVRR